MVGDFLLCAAPPLCVALSSAELTGHIRTSMLGGGFGASNDMVGLCLAVSYARA